MDSIYLDHNSTTPMLPEVAAAMDEARRTGLGNPESQHAFGRRARRLLEDARERIGELLGVRSAGPTPDRVIFTSGGTEANNWALWGLAGALKASAPGDGAKRRVLVSTIEHPSVARAAQWLAAHGCRVDRLEVSRDGCVRIDHLRELLQSAGGARPVLSVMLANNETGAIQPLDEIAALAAQAGAAVHADGTQAVGKMPVDFHRLQLTALTCAAHKFHGPVGVGVLVVRGETEIEPLFYGGSQQLGFRPGTENVLLAVGMRAALEAAVREMGERRARMQTLRDRLEAALMAAWPGAVVIAAGAPRLPNTSCVAFPGLDRQALVMAFDLAGVACSTGSACASGSSEPSPTLLAMRLEPAIVASAMRFSIGATTTAEEIETAIGRITETLRRHRPAGAV